MYCFLVPWFFFFPIGALTAPLLACSLMLLSLLVHRWLYRLLVPVCFFHCICTDGSIACQFIEVPFNVGALIAC